MTDTDYLHQVASIPFRLPRPEDLPTTIADIEVPEARKLSEIREHEVRGSLEDLLKAIRMARADLGNLSTVVVVDDPAETRPNRDNDRAFGIERHHGPALPLLLRASLAAYEGIVDLVVEQGSGVDPETWFDLVAGFELIHAWLADPSTEPVTPASPPPRPSTGFTEWEALRKWVRGHHVFMVFAQGCALGVRILIDAAARDDGATGTIAASVAARLMRACRAALCFAGDSSQDQYQEQIRPTLMPPIAPPQMSGLRWRDHEFLVRALTESTDAWSWLAESRPDLLYDFRAALDATYSAHKGVCAHFVGTESPSLLATSRSQRSAVGVLDQFHRIRRQTLPDPLEHGEPVQGGDS